VRFLSLMAFSLIIITKQFRSSFSYAHTGMRLPNFECILIICWRFSRTLPQNWGIGCDCLLLKRVQNTIRLNFLVRLRHMIARNPKSRNPTLQVLIRPREALAEGNIITWTHISTMPLEIMLTPFVPMEHATPTAQNWSVKLLYGLAVTLMTVNFP
jgi:hypothetical protein